MRFWAWAAGESTRMATVASRNVVAIGDRLPWGPVVGIRARKGRRARSRPATGPPATSEGYPGAEEARNPWQPGPCLRGEREAGRPDARGRDIGTSGARL